MLTHVTETVRACARLLGWSGLFIPDTVTLGERSAAVVQLATTPTEWCERLGDVPVCDRTELAWLAEQNPGIVDWIQPVRVVGFIVTRRTWRGARGAASGLAGLGPTSVLLPRSAIESDAAQLEAQVAGLGLVASDGCPPGVTVVSPPGARFSRRRSMIDVLVDQQLYRAALAASEPRAA
jgi:hypothetical protein